MDITEVRVKLVDGGHQDKLKAYCSITIDDAFVIRDLKIIEGTRGLFVAMPSRKLTVRCPKCSGKNQIRSKFCSECGARIPSDSATRARDGRSKMHADIAHPINSQCREAIQSRVLDDYEVEREASLDPDYQPHDLDDYDDDDCPESGAASNTAAASDTDSDWPGTDRLAASQRGTPSGSSPTERVDAVPSSDGAPAGKRDDFDNFSDGLFGS